MKGKQPENLRTSWIDCAHRMGYFCAENNETSLPFDGLMYRDAVVVAVKLKKVRYSPGEDFILEKKFPDEVAALRTLPLPSTVAREIWLRTQNERAFRRFWILPDTTAEIEEVTRDGLPESPLPGGVLGEGSLQGHPLLRGPGKGADRGRGERHPEKPVKCPDWQTDDPVFRLEWKWCPRP